MSDLKVGSGPGSESKSFASSFSPRSFVWCCSLIDFYAQKWLMEWKASLYGLVLKNMETRGFVFLEGWAGSVLWCFVEWHFKSKVALGLDQITWYMLYSPSSNLVWSRTGLNFCGETGKKDSWPAVAGRWSHFQCLWCTCSMLFWDEIEETITRVRSYYVFWEWAGPVSSAGAYALPFDIDSTTS